MSDPWELYDSHEEQLEALDIDIVAEAARFALDEVEREFEQAS